MLRSWGLFVICAGLAANSTLTSASTCSRDDVTETKAVPNPAGKTTLTVRVWDERGGRPLGLANVELGRPFHTTDADAYPCWLCDDAPPAYSWHEGSSERARPPDGVLRVEIETESWGQATGRFISQSVPAKTCLRVSKPQCSGRLEGPVTIREGHDNVVEAYLDCAPAGGTVVVIPPRAPPPPPSPAERPEPAPVPAATPDTAILTLGNDETLSGRVSNPTFILQTSGGTLTLKSTEIATIEIGASGTGNDVVRLRNGDRLSGVIKDASVRMRVAAGEVTVAKASIRSVRFPAEDSTIPATPAAATPSGPAARQLGPTMQAVLANAQAALDREDWNGALATLRGAEAAAALTPYERFSLDSLRETACIGLKDHTCALDAMERRAASPFMSPGDRRDIDRRLAQLSLAARNYLKAVAYGEKCVASHPDDTTILYVLIRGYDESRQYHRSLVYANYYLQLPEVVNNPDAERTKIVTAIRDNAVRMLQQRPL